MMKKIRLTKSSVIFLCGFLMLVLLLGSNSARSTIKSLNVQETVREVTPPRKTYEEQIVEIIEIIEEVPVGLPSDEITTKSTFETYDAKKNYKKLKTVYLKILALKPPEHQRTNHKRILRNLKYAIDGMTILADSGNTLNQSKLTQSLLLINLNIDDIQKVKDKLPTETNNHIKSNY